MESSLSFLGLGIKPAMTKPGRVAAGRPERAQLGDALRGVAPLLAPGGIALGALLAAAATHRHPAFENRRGVD
jgi:ABC-type dipeptide/oligopeptide/nickel transport system permease subunit